MRAGKTTKAMVAGAALAVAAAVLWQNLQPRPVASEAPLPPVGADSPPEVELDSADAHEEAVSAGPRRNAAPANRAAEPPPHIDPTPEIANIHTIDVDNIAARVDENIGLALGGDVHAAYFLPKAFEHCRRVPRDRLEMEEYIQGLEDYARQQRERDPGQPFPFNFGPGNTRIEGEADIRPTWSGWFRACQAVRSLFTPDFRHELDRLASGGHVIARYLYSQWPVEKSDPRVAFEDLMAWEAKARDYSLDNLQEGEPLGMLAFAQSYQLGRFTRPDLEMTFGFAHAAMNCGLGVENVQRYVDNFMERATKADQMAYLARLEFALRVSESVTAYCRN